MIRKQTAILLIIFAALVGLAFYLQKNPLPAADADVTPSATPQPSMLSGWQSADITWMELKDNLNGASARLVGDPLGNWMLEEEGKTVDLGKVEQLRSQIIDTRVTASLSGSYALDALELSQPAYVLTLRNSAGKQSVINIGAATPTDTGYYVQVDGQSPVVAGKAAIDSILDQFKPEKLFDYTPTPEPTATLEATASGTEERGSAADATPQPGSPTATRKP